MTITQLAELTADQLKALTDKQLDEILRPYYTVTRPELAPKPVKNSEPKQQELYISPEKRKALELLKESGIDCSFMDRKFKKK